MWVDFVVSELVDDPLDRINIIMNEDGICDVVLWQGHKQNHLSKRDDCTPGTIGVIEKDYRITKEAPLVGFHGVTDSVAITDLGLIFVDAMTPSCQRVHSEVDSDKWATDSLWDASRESENILSTDEKQRAKALETILLYDSMVAARKSSAEISNQIKQLLA